MTEIKISGIMEETYHLMKNNFRVGENLIAKITVGLSLVGESFATMVRDTYDAYYLNQFFVPAAFILIGDAFGKTKFSKISEGEYQLSKSKLHSVVAASADIGILASTASLCTGLITGNPTAVEGGKWGLLALLPFRIGDVARASDYRNDSLPAPIDGLLPLAIRVVAHSTDPYEVKS